MIDLLFALSVLVGMVTLLVLAILWGRETHPVLPQGEHENPEPGPFEWTERDQALFDVHAYFASPEERS